MVLSKNVGETLLYMSPDVKFFDKKNLTPCAYKMNRRWRNFLQFYQLRSFWDDLSESYSEVTRRGR